jgi:hypothetical protein
LSVTGSVAPEIPAPIKMIRAMTGNFIG